MTEQADYNRLFWHSRRGMLEVDLILLPFLEKAYRQLPADDQQRYVRLLESEDQDLFSWFMQHKEPEDPELAQIVRVILAFRQR